MNDIDFKRQKYLERRRELYQLNKDRIKEQNKDWYLRNKDKAKRRKLRWKENNKEKYIAQFKKHNAATAEKKAIRYREKREQNREEENRKQREKRRNRTPEQKLREKEYRKQYNLNNIEKIKEYHKNNRARRRETKKAWHHKKYRSDERYKLVHNLRSRIKYAIKGTAKDSTSLSLLGCTVIIFRNHIESLFTEGMNWERVLSGEIHIDHIRPCSKFDLTKPEEQKKCFHYTNLQPLWEVDNLKKGAKYG